MSTIPIEDTDPEMLAGEVVDDSDLDEGPA